MDLFKLNQLDEEIAHKLVFISYICDFVLPALNALQSSNFPEMQVCIEESILRLFQSRFFGEFQEDQAFAGALIARHFRLKVRFENLFTPPISPCSKDMAGSAFDLESGEPLPRSTFTSFTAVITEVFPALQTCNFEKSSNNPNGSVFSKVDEISQVLSCMPVTYLPDGSGSFKPSSNRLSLGVTDELVGRFSVGQHVFCIGSINLGPFSLKPGVLAVGSLRCDVNNLRVTNPAKHAENIYNELPFHSNLQVPESDCLPGPLEYSSECVEDWSLTAMIIDSFAPVTPPGWFPKLKLILLLSLVSGSRSSALSIDEFPVASEIDGEIDQSFIKASARDGINLLVLTDEVLASRCLHYAAELHSHRVFFSAVPTEKHDAYTPDLGLLLVDTAYPVGKHNSDHLREFLQSQRSRDDGPVVWVSCVPPAKSLCIPPLMANLFEMSLVVFNTPDCARDVALCRFILDPLSEALHFESESNSEGSGTSETDANSSTSSDLIYPRPDEYHQQYCSSKRLKSKDNLPDTRKLLFDGSESLADDSNCHPSATISSNHESPTITIKIEPREENDSSTSRNSTLFTNYFAKTSACTPNRPEQNYLTSFTDNFSSNIDLLENSCLENQDSFSLATKSNSFGNVKKDRADVDLSPSSSALMKYPIMPLRNPMSFRGNASVVDRLKESIQAKAAGLACSVKSLFVNYNQNPGLSSFSLGSNQPLSNSNTSSDLTEKMSSCDMHRSMPSGLPGSTLQDLPKLPLFGLNSPSNQSDPSVRSVLPSASDTVVKLFKDSKKLFEYIQLARALNVNMGASSSELIRGFFLACRRLHEYRMADLHSLLCFARAHCRLQCRKTVSILDAVVGIMMMEEAVASEGRRSALGFEARPHGELNLNSVYPGTTILHKFKGFYRQLLGFIQQNR